MKNTEFSQYFYMGSQKTTSINRQNKFQEKGKKVNLISQISIMNQPLTVVTTQAENILENQNLITLIIFNAKYSHYSKDYWSPRKMLQFHIHHIIIVYLPAPPQIQCF